MRNSLKPTQLSLPGVGESPGPGQRLRRQGKTGDLVAGRKGEKAKLIDIRGRMFGWYRADKHLGNGFWQCTCTKCGSTHRVRSVALRRGRSTCCRKCSEANRNHGYSLKRTAGQTKTYCAWVGMRQRCYNKNERAYKWYGALGIKVCPRWMKFQNFLEDMGDAPPGMWLDRKDSKGDYEPGNCRWATPAQQMANKPGNHFVLYYGEKMTCSEAAKKMGFKKVTLSNWLKRHPEFDSDISRLYHEATETRRLQVWRPEIAT